MISELAPKVKRQHSPVTRITSRVQPSTPEQKTALVNLGLELLAMGEMDAVDAITRLIQRGGMADA